MFNPSTFIAPYGVNDKFIRILDTNSNIVQTINICRYIKSRVISTILYVTLEGSSADYPIVFNSFADSTQGLFNFKQTIDTLINNCNQNSSGGSGSSPTPIIITLVAFSALQSTNSLIALQWYDVTDTTNLLFNDSTYTIRLLTSSTNDRHPRGQMLATGASVTIDVPNHKIISYEDSVNNIFLTNSLYIGSSFTSSNNCTAINGSNIIAVSSNGIFAENGSIINVTNSSLVKATNASNVIVTGANNVSFDNIQMNLSALGFNLSNVDINRNESVGKAGRNTSINPSNLIFSSYKDVIDQSISFSTNNNTINATLVNLLTQANGSFRIKYIGSGTNNIINVLDSSSTLIYSIKDNNKNIPINFVYNSITSKFELVGSANTSTGIKTIQFSSVTANQTTFNLGYPVTNPSELEMYLNGIKLVNGVDFSYNQSTSIVTYNSSIALIVGDFVEFRVN